MQASSDCFYKRDPLDRSQRLVRLIKISPELTNSGRIKCVVRHATIDSQYQCLSYTWGSAGEVRFIDLNGALFPVRANLWQYLDAAREVYPTNEEFWIDAMCI